MGNNPQTLENLTEIPFSQPISSREEIFKVISLLVKGLNIEITYCVFQFHNFNRIYVYINFSVVVHYRGKHLAYRIVG